MPFHVEHLDTRLKLMRMGQRKKVFRRVFMFILPSVTSPKEEKASLRDFSSTDHDNPETPSVSEQKADH